MRGLLDIHSPVNYGGAKQYISDCIFLSEQESWLKKINDANGRRAGSRNKLRVYCTFKSSLKTETYVNNSISYRQRRALAQFRTGIACPSLAVSRLVGKIISAACGFAESTFRILENLQFLNCGTDFLRQSQFCHNFSSFDGLSATNKQMRGHL